MGVEKLTPRNPKALSGIRLRGAVPSLHKRGIGTSKDSPSLRQFQERGTSDGSGP